MVRAGDHGPQSSFQSVAVFGNDQRTVAACNAGPKDHARDAIWGDLRMVKHIREERGGLPAQYLRSIRREQNGDGSVR